MITTMLVSRSSKWFFFEDTNLDPYYFSIKMLQKLSTNKARGLKYNRMELIQKLVNKKGHESLKTLDASIIILLSRNLISVVTDNSFTSRLFITKDGINALETFRRELKNANRKN